MVKYGFIVILALSLLNREKKKVESSIQDKSQTLLSCNPSLWRPRKKDLSYCECCHEPFTNLEEVKTLKIYFYWNVTDVSPPCNLWSLLVLAALAVG